LAFPHRHFFAPVFRKQRAQKTGRPCGRPALKQELTSVQPRGEGFFAIRAFSSTVFHTSPNFSPGANGILGRAGQMRDLPVGETQTFRFG
jgi:hypothetical protein